MAIQPYSVRDENDEDVIGAVLVCNTSGLPLPVNPKAFDDVDDALAFEEWVGCDLRRYDPDELAELAFQWNDRERERWADDAGHRELEAIGAEG